MKRYRHKKIGRSKLFDPRSFKTIGIGRHGRKMIIGCPKGQWMSRLKRCRVGMRGTSILTPTSKNPGFVESIRAGDRVTIALYHGGQATGRAVMKSGDGRGWVLNLGGRHGTPGLAYPENTVRVSKGKRQTYLNSQQQRVSGVATKIRSAGGSGGKVISYRGTDVVSFDDSKIVLNTGGWKTATTKTRMNQACNQFGLGCSVNQRGGEWFVGFGGREIPFTGNTLTLSRHAAASTIAANNRPGRRSMRARARNKGPNPELLIVHNPYHRRKKKRKTRNRRRKHVVKHVRRASRNRKHRRRKNAHRRIRVPKWVKSYNRRRKHRKSKNTRRSHSRKSRRGHRRKR